MNNAMRAMFEKIHAEAALKQKTEIFLRERIQQGSAKAPARPFRAAAFASLLLCIILGGLSYNLYFSTSAYVDIDVNPSVELAVNRLDIVIGVTPYNGDGEIILQGINMRHMRYQDAADHLIGAMAQSGYLHGDMVSVTVQTHDDSKEHSMLGNLRSALANALLTNRADARVNVFAVSEEIKCHAHEMAVTPAKYLAISALRQVDPDASFEHCRDHSISEIMQMTHAHECVHGADGCELHSGDEAHALCEEQGHHSGAH